DDAYIISTCTGGGRLVRYDDHGAPDVAFAPAFPGTKVFSNAGALFVVHVPATGNAAVAKLKSTGALDTSYATGGQWMPSGSNVEIRQLGAASDGGLLVAYADRYEHRLKVVRLDRNGALEPGFSGSYDDSVLPIDGVAQRCDRTWVLPVAYDF